MTLVQDQLGIADTVTTTLPHQPSDAQPPNRKQVVSRIRAEARAAGVACSTKSAGAVLDMISQAADHARRGQDYMLSMHEMNYYHPVIDVIMVDDDQAPAPGTAHAMLNRLLCRGREVCIIHSRDRNDDCILGLRMHKAG